jgi:GxxExxY protein
MEYQLEEFVIEAISDISVHYGDEQLNKLTYEIIGAAMEVHNTLGRGFLESVYKDCLCIEFRDRGLGYVKEKKFEIYYKGEKIAHHFFADFVIEERVVLEIKSQNTVVDENLKQVINYLAVSKCKIGLLINFGDNSLRFKRIILT